MLLHLRVHLCALFLALSPLASLAHPSQTVLSLSHAWPKTRPLPIAPSRSRIPWKKQAPRQPPDKTGPALPQPSTAAKTEFPHQRYQTVSRHKVWCRVFSGRCSQKWGLLCLHHLSWPWPPQCVQMRVQHPVGRLPCSMQEEQQRPPRQPSRQYSMLRLAAAKWVLSDHPRLLPRMLRMQQLDSWSSRLSSSTKGLMQHRPTTQKYGKDTYLQLDCNTNTPISPQTSGLALM